MPDKIVVIDDETEIADLIELYLLNEGYMVYKFYSGNEALKFIETTEADLIVLDIMLPDMDGFEICRHIRENYIVPIIMLTAKDEEIDKIRGLSLGADYYVTKPFLPLELVAIVKAQLRRYKRYNPLQDAVYQEAVIFHAGLMMNIKTHECTLNEKKLILTPTEFSILRILLQHKGEVVSSESLFHEIWENEYYRKDNNTITVHIRHLREKMGDSFEKPKYIKTVWGCGYKIETYY